MKKRTRLTALLLVLVLMLANISASATITTEEYSLAELDMELYSELLENAQGVGLAVNQPCGSDNPYCANITYMAKMATAQERYDYINKLDMNAVRGLLIHYEESHADESILCLCEADGVFVPGDIDNHNINCPWHFANLPISEEYAFLTKIPKDQRSVYVNTIADEEKRQLLEAYLSYEENTFTDPCDPDSCDLIAEHGMDFFSENAFTVYNYVKDLYENINDFADQTRYYTLVAHLRDAHIADGVYCQCQSFDITIPEHAYGTIFHSESSVGGQVVECPWRFDKLTTEEQAQIYSNLSDDEKPVYYAELNDSQKAALDNFLNGVGKDNIDVTPADGAVSVNISVPEGVFGSGITYVMEAEEALMTTDKVNALNAAVTGHTLAAFDISFYDLNRPGTELQPTNGSIPLTFTVDVSKAEGNWMQVYHLDENSDGSISVEFIGDPITIDKSAGSCQITVNATSFSIYGVLAVCDGEACGYNAYVQNDGFGRYDEMVKYVNGAMYTTYYDFTGHINGMHLGLDEMAPYCTCADFETNYANLTYGSINHGEDSMNPGGYCAWHFSQIPVEDEYIVYQTLTEEEKAAALATITDPDKLAALENLIGNSEPTDPDAIPCAICGKANCETAHLYCHIHNKFDCTEEHSDENTPNVPVTTPVIPENPQLPDGEDVSIVDAQGNSVTGGITLNPGERASFSAWSDNETGASYQWQICYDIENDLWVDIQGQTAKGILISPAMVQSVIEATGSAVIRCEITSGETVKYSAQIPVTIAQEVTLDQVMFGLARNARAAAAAAGETPELTEYTITINYIFEDSKEPVAEPYKATLAAGSVFNATVSHPKVMGYLPHINGVEESSENIKFEITSIDQSYEYNVIYRPADVNYKVIHYQQNIDNDNYVIAETETLQGLTKSTVPDVAKAYSGFYALLYERPEIAADGSTVVEIYYDRNYYLMTFDLGGGYGVEPIYARYGAPIEVGTPTRAGYTFLGWTLDGTDAVEISETMPAQNTKYIALWKAADSAKVSVVFWGENPNDEGYSYLATGVVNAKPDTKYTFADGDEVFLICGKDEHTHTTECTLICGKTEHTTHTEDCISCVHTHDLSCYNAYQYTIREGTPDPDANMVPTQYDGIYTYNTVDNGGETETHYYLYLDGVWYCCYQGRFGGDYVKADTNRIRENCSHTHGEECYSCEVHSHVTECYSCGMEVHVHDSSCNQTGSGLDSTLWTFVRSETVTVAADGSSVVNVYYDRTAFTMTFRNSEDHKEKPLELLATIEDKWGADIRARFAQISQDNTFFWSRTADGYSPWTSFMDVMPAEGRTYYGYDWGGDYELSATYLGQNLERTDYEELYKVSFNFYDPGVLVSKEEFVDIEGFTFNEEKSTKINANYNGAQFFYDRHAYVIEYYNPTTLLRKTEDVPYQSPLGSYSWTPDPSDAPEQYEPGSVVFEGWYLNPECSGEKFDFANSTMPAGTNDGDTTLTLYAKWTPVIHTVEFYLDKAAMEDGEKLTTHPDQNVSHGDKLVPVPEEPDNDDYEFVNWFYLDDEGNETPFDFANMSINRDMKVYGKWSSNVLKEYTVYFKVEGTDTEIAAPITGSAKAGLTKTFEAKVGTELYEAYQNDGYFPLVKSHSITLDIEDAAKNTFTFWYVKKDAVPYTVYYVAETLKDGEDPEEFIERDGKTYYIIADTFINSDNHQAVVTEKFVPVDGYMPDAYQKRLIVEADEGAVNEIIFYYSVDTVHAYYRVTHYIENINGDGWTEYRADEYVGEVGKTYDAGPITIVGFTYDPDISTVSGTLTLNGLELELYYHRNMYSYEVRYLDQISGEPLAEPKDDGSGKYGQVITEDAIDILGYTVDGATSKTLVIDVDENVITFYYVENVAMISYEVVGPDGCGNVSPVSETVKVLTGSAKGSAATATENYNFVGWYSDKECTTQISTEADYVPTKPANGWTNVTYYAKFELAVADLTISKTGLREGESAIFEVNVINSNDTDYPKTFKVVLTGTDAETVSQTIEGLLIGSSYTVTELTDWSWKYNLTTTNHVTGTIAASGNTASFTNSRKTEQWLYDESAVVNVFGESN